MMANIMERLDKALPGPSGTRDVPAGQPRQVLRTASSPILQELHDPEDVERERQAVNRRRAEEMARNSKVNEGQAKDPGRIFGDGHENPRGSVFERISRQKAHVSERLGKNLEKAPQGWIRPQASQVASSNREPRQRNDRGVSQVPVRSLRNLEDDEVQSQARVPAPRRLGPPVPEAGEFQDLRQQIQEMQRKINKGRVFTTRTNTPLAPEIFAEPYPQGFKMPFVKRYDGESDPQEHINSYVQVMIAVDASDALMCRCFLQTVDSKVADWVNHIPAGSIRTWDELGLRFLEHFAGNCRPKKHFTHLASVRQKHGESLKNFLIRWRKESSEVEGTDDKSRLAMFTAALQDGLLHTDLTTHPPDTFEEAMVRAGRYVTLEERKEEKKEKTPKEEEKMGSKKPFKNKKQGFPDGPKGASPGASEKHKSANPVFTLPVAEVMAHAAQQGLMTYPTYSQKVCNVEDTGKWCAYHRKNDHNTEDCYTLKNEMARLIRRGHLKTFVQDGDTGNPGNAQNGKRRDKEVAQAEAREKRHIGLEDEEEDSEPAPHRQKRHHGCNFIIGGNTGGDSATSRKKWANAATVNKVLVPEGKKLKTEPIVFSNADLPETGVPHRDALVITIDIMDLLIHKTLVDTGSSVNIMYMDTYKALGLTRDELSPIKTPLTSFTGDSIEPEGVITLPVEIGDTKATRKLDMEFVVVGIISSTNIILGRPGLEDLECVISPRHLCIKFPTPYGVGIARGSQRVSRAWYLKATKQPVKYDTQVGEVTAQFLRAEEKRPRVEVAGDIEEVELEPGTPGRLVRVGKGLGAELRSRVISVLRRFRKVFAWSPADMPGLDHKIAVHRLNVLPDAKPVKQKRRHLSQERRDFVKKEVATLQSIGYIRECLDRFDHRFGSENYDPEFAKKLASLADLYVNDAFGTAHRAHASTEGVAKFLKPAVVGFLMQKELDYLVGAVTSPKKPFAAIVGGSKVSTKIVVIESLLEKVDLLLLGGGMIFTFYKAQGHNVGSSLLEEDKLDLATSLIEKANAKGVSLLLPTDVVVADKFSADANSKVVTATEIPDGWMGLDVGPDTIKSFGEALNATQTIIWNGPMGVFEFDKFAAGAEAIAKKLPELSL
ncbi:unnamed protein product [Cuscuta campestris]|uniref:Phosphoglycerate kinase n=1 Tax=Cuscuta campestris TaxID=132261 RepID=A0A484LAP9_9ASTE|nr:unnamed protein product [Cuscuta campestris]